MEIITYAYFGTEAEQRLLARQIVKGLLKKAKEHAVSNNNFAGRDGAGLHARALSAGSSETTQLNA